MSDDPVCAGLVSGASSGTRRPARYVVMLSHAVCGLVAGLLLYAAAGPVATDDIWWHLTLGREYARAGPPLAEDLRLHTAAGPPDANSWLFDRAAAGLAETAGIGSLRVLHALLVALLLTVVWWGLRRASGSLLFGSLSTSLFAGIGAYRLLQLRPSLATMLATAILYFGVIARPRLSLGRMALGIVVCAIWVHLHPGFPLGPGLLGIAALGAAAAAREDTRARERATRLAVTAAGGLLVCGLHPDGLAAVGRYVGAGAANVGQVVVIDEWRPFALLGWPSLHLPPTPLAWLGSWGIVAGVALGLVAVFGPLARQLTAFSGDARAGRAEGRAWLPRDPGLIALALVGAVAPFVAVRFQWMNLLALGWLASVWRIRTPQAPSTHRPAWALVVAVALLAGLVWGSGWRILAPRGGLDRYREPYATDRYYAHAVWFLADTGVEGRLFHPYFMGGFVEYWLSPRLTAFVDGSLNVPASVLADYGSILTAGGSAEGLHPARLLDRYGVDFFIGVGLPILPPPGRPWRYTTTHLERHPDWLLVYRGLRSAVYLRRSERNRANLARIARYYAAQGVPFDRERGLDVERMLSTAGDWSIRHGAAPRDLRALLGVAPPASSDASWSPGRRSGLTYAALGLYDEALAMAAASSAGGGQGGERGADMVWRRRDRERLRAWLGLRRDDPGAARRAAAWLAAGDRARDPLVGRLVAAVRAYLATDDPDLRARIAAVTPGFTRAEAAAIRAYEDRAPTRSP